MFFSIMVDFPRSLLLMSTWKLFVLSKSGGSFQNFFTKGIFLSEVSFIEKSYRWVVGGVCRRLCVDVQAAMWVAHCIIKSPQVPCTSIGDFWGLGLIGTCIWDLDLGLTIDHFDFLYILSKFLIMYTFYSLSWLHHLQTIPTFGRRRMMTVKGRSL